MKDLSISGERRGRKRTVCGGRRGVAEELVVTPAENGVIQVTFL